MLLWPMISCTAGIDMLDTELTVQTDLTAPVDECTLPCITVSGPDDVELTLRADGQLLDSGRLESGTLSLCPPQGSLTPSTTVTIEQDDAPLLTTTLDVRPFGYAQGRTRSWGAPESLEWTADWVLEPWPILMPAEGTWYGDGITSPHLVGERLYFSGRAIPGGPYILGTAEFDGAAVTEVSSVPLLEPASGDWDAAGQVSPTLVQLDGEQVLFFQGLGESADVPVLGRASTSDGTHWFTMDSSVYGDPLTDKISHPSALAEENDLIALWHLTESGSFGLSLSDDGGHSFTPSCIELPMRGKSPEVVWMADRYLMTWATVADGEEVIRWAESLDGVRWRERDESILSAPSSLWTVGGLSNAQLISIDERPHLLLVGVSSGRQAFGLAAMSE